MGIVVKGMTVPALLVKLDESLTVDENISQIKAKLGSDFFKGSLAVIDYESAKLSEGDMMKIEEAVRNTNARFIGYKPSLKLEKNKKVGAPPQPVPAGVRTLRLIDKSIRSGQNVEHDGDVEIVSEETRAGESWAGGPVILSWRDVEHGLAVPDDGYNVVLHEFAHKLDDENEIGEGLPLLRDPAQLESWAQVLSREFAALRQGDGTLLDDYGAVSPAEFFAVVTEAFFEQARDLAQQHPALYAEFSRYYGLDPASWSA